MSDADDVLNALISNIDKTKIHRLQYAEQLDAVTAAKKQVTTSHQRSLKQLQEHFNKLRSDLNELLTNRENILRSEVEQIEKDALAPLETCEKSVQENLNSCAQFMEQGKRLLMGEPDANMDAMVEYNKTIGKASFDSVSAVPALQDVQCIHVDLPLGLDSELRTMLEDYGTVFARAPVQITQICELPGALKIHWHEIEEESDLDLSDFKLQYRRGQITEDSSDLQFAYQGTNKSAVVRRLNLGDEYSFRVCGKAETAVGWSPWSVPVTAATFLPHYEWKADSDNGYVLSSDCRLVTKQSSDSCMILSDGASFMCGHSILFKVLQDAEVRKEDGFFLTISKDIQDPANHKGTLFINSEGKIFQDGELRTTRLEKFSRNSSITFDTETLEANKIRITIEMNNKYTVTFDWTLDITKQHSDQSDLSMAMMGGAMASGDSAKPAIHLYFGAKFTSSGWRFSVE